MKVIEPVTLEEAKAHLRVEFDDDDTYITALISAAREYVESFQNRYIAERQYEEGEEELPVVPCGEMEKQAMLLMLGHWYSHREAVSHQNMMTVPMGAESLLWFNREVPV